MDENEMNIEFEMHFAWNLKLRPNLIKVACNWFPKSYIKRTDNILHACEESNIIQKNVITTITLQRHSWTNYKYLIHLSLQFCR